MKRKMLLTTGIIALFAFTVKAQVCGTTFNAPVVQQTDPARYNRFLQQEQKTAAYITAHKQARLINDNSNITIPVVVHVLHNGEPVGVGNNISDAQVQSQIDVLNENFRNLNPSRGNIPAAFVPFAADANINFQLACVDPNGNPTSGIHRVQAGRAAFTYVSGDEVATGIKFTAQGGTDAWPTDRYLNIWVCNIAAFPDGSQLLGYAQFPFDYAAKPTTDGVVILNTAFGRNPWNAIVPDDHGSTTAHETGHWLNLYHIWGDDGGACTGSDQCDDTPNQADAHQVCPGFPAVSCGNGPNGDMYMNYMDYTVVGCNRNMFTAGQVARMRSVFTGGGVRAGFVNNYFAVTAPASICNTGTVALTNPACLQGVTWSISGPATIAPNGNTALVTANGYGTATVTATVNGYTDSKTITIAPVNPPTPVISWRGNCPGTIGYCANSGTYYILNPVAGATYQYSYDGSNWTNASTPPSFYVPCDGSLDVYIRMVGCSGNVSAAAHQVSRPLPDYICFPKGHGQRLAVQPTTADSTGTGVVTISPNPSTGTILVAVPENRFVREIRLVNVIGVVVKRMQYSAGLHTATINAPGLAAGVYIVQVYDGSQWTSRQVVIK